MNAAAGRLVRLVRRALEGDALALDAVLAEIRDPVLRYHAKRLGGEREGEDLALDLVQQAFLRVAAGLGTCRADTDARFLAWCLAVARNVLRDHYAATRSERESRHFPPDLELVAGTASLREWEAQTEGPSEADRILSRLLEESFEVLSPSARDIVVDHVLSGMPWREMSSTLGTTADGAKRRFQRAQDRLRNDLLSRLRDLPDPERRLVSARLRMMGVAI